MKEPMWLWMFLLFIPFLYKKRGAIGYSYLKGGLKTPLLSRIYTLLPYVITALMILALARPHYDIKPKPQKREGIDIVLAVDTSESMLAQDFVASGTRVSRLAVVKSVLIDFVKRRVSDNIGLVIFGEVAFTRAPLTYDHKIIMDYLESIQAGVAGKATAIGDAIAVSAQRLEAVEGKSRLIILLTDGRQTAGTLTPQEAAQAAAELGYKVYVVGVGAKPSSLFGGFFSQPDGLDEATLKEVAQLGGGQFFRAENTDDLVDIYTRIDELEKNKLDGKVEYESKEGFMFFLWPAFIFLMLEMLLSLTRYRVLP